MYGPDISSSEDDDFSEDFYLHFDRGNNRYANEHVEEQLTEEEKQKKKLQTIFTAISYGKDASVIEEFNNGFDINADLSNGWTPFLLAATAANYFLIEDLIQRNVELDQMRDGTTALMYACNNNTDDEKEIDKIFDIVQLLVAKGADVNLLDRKRRNSLMLAAYNGHIKVVEFLLPLTDKHHQDSQNWTALFWAVEGNRAKTVKFLLDEGFDPNHIDVRGNTVYRIAESNNFEDILRLFPESSDDEFYVNITKSTDFERTFEALDKYNLPVLRNEICKLLYGARSENVIPLMMEKKVSLLDFLSLDSLELEKLGVMFPYQRKRIVGGLYKFHKHPFNRKSVPHVPKSGLFSNIDVSVSLLACQRQTIAMTASLRFIKKLLAVELSPAATNQLGNLAKLNRLQVLRLQKIVQSFIRKTEMWDASLKPGDRITKKRKNVPWSNIFASFALISVALITYKIYV